MKKNTLTYKDMYNKLKEEHNGVSEESKLLTPDFIKKKNGELRAMQSTLANEKKQKNTETVSRLKKEIESMETEIKMIKQKKDEVDEKNKQFNTVKTQRSIKKDKYQAKIDATKLKLKNAETFKRDLKNTQINYETQQIENKFHEDNQRKQKEENDALLEKRKIAKQEYIRQIEEQKSIDVEQGDIQNENENNIDEQLEELKKEKPIAKMKRAQEYEIQVAKKRQEFLTMQEILNADNWRQTNKHISTGKKQNKKSSVQNSTTRFNKRTLPDFDLGHLLNGQKSSNTIGPPKKGH
jgi:hypothetical protein